MSNWRLTILEPNREWQWELVIGRSATIGRDGDVRLEGNYASREHLTIKADGRSVTVTPSTRDGGALAPTRVVRGVPSEFTIIRRLFGARCGQVVIDGDCAAVVDDEGSWSASVLVEVLTEGTRVTGDFLLLLPLTMVLLQSPDRQRTRDRTRVHRPSPPGQLGGVQTLRTLEDWAARGCYVSALDGTKAPTRRGAVWIPDYREGGFPGEATRYNADAYQERLVSLARDLIEGTFVPVPHLYTGSPVEARTGAVVRTEDQLAYVDRKIGSPTDVAQFGAAMGEWLAATMPAVAFCFSNASPRGRWLTARQVEKAIAQSSTCDYVLDATGPDCELRVRGHPPRRLTPGEFPLVFAAIEKGSRAPVSPAQLTVGPARGSSKVFQTARRKLDTRVFFREHRRGRASEYSFEPDDGVTYCFLISLKAYEEMWRSA